MKPFDEITLTIDGASVTLRPSLMAVTKLERLRDGFGGLIAAILDGSLTVANQIIATAATDANQANKFLASLNAMPLIAVPAIIETSLLQFVYMMAGVDPASPAQSRPPQGTPVSYEEHHRQLYAIATGWLGWSPATAWQATPWEIVNAYDGLKDKLRVIHGSSEAQPDDPTKPVSDDQVRDGLSKLRILAG